METCFFIIDGLGKVLSASELVGYATAETTSCSRGAFYPRKSPQCPRHTVALERVLAGCLAIASGLAQRSQVQQPISGLEQGERNSRSQGAHSRALVEGPVSREWSDISFNFLLGAKVGFYILRETPPPIAAGYQGEGGSKNGGDTGRQLTSPTDPGWRVTPWWGQHSIHPNELQICEEDTQNLRRGA